MVIEMANAGRRGRKWLRRHRLNKSLLLDELPGGWQVSSVYVIEGGTPIGITTGNKISMALGCQRL
jgi:hypothetical protein